ACMGNPSLNQIVVNFSKPMDIGLTQSSVAINPSIGASYVWSSNNTVLTIIPDLALTLNQRYTVAFGLTATDSNNIPLLSPVIGSFLVGTNNSSPQVSTMTTFTGTAPTCVAGGGAAVDFIANNVTNGCIRNPTNNSIAINFNTPMDPAVTQAAVTISPNVSGTYVWSANNQTLTFTSDFPLLYGVRYTVSLSTVARSSTLINISAPVIASFVAGAVSLSPHVQSIGVASQGCPLALPGVGSAAGGNWLIGSCWWDDTLSILSTGNYTFRSGDTGTGVAGSTNDCADINTDNFRIIFSDYMNVTNTINAITLRRSSPPTTTVQLSSWQWNDCQAVFPFGCRVVDLVYAEQEASCNGALFGDATTGGDFNLLRTNNAPANFPYYLLQVDTTALDSNGRPLAPQFNFTFEGK
ncbi:MAG: Ig-like domain-containing protein, partial [Leptospira sp.]|nr:Ig-like domain-containing protein [Leptospira sp.]